MGVGDTWRLSTVAFKKEVRELTSQCSPFISGARETRPKVPQLSLRQCLFDLQRKIFVKNLRGELLTLN
jgi:hypothetical protein